MSGVPTTATGTADQVRRGTLTARAAVQAALDAIADRDPAIGAFQVVRSAAALREADEVDRRPDRASLSMAGVPVAVKDNVPVKGEPLGKGSRSTDPTPQTSDHEVVRRLREAGAVVVGLTRVPELSVWGTTDSAFGVTCNPQDPQRTPGGSSGGSAAAVAAGMVPVAHGNDGMGSLRIPAACCGLVTIKPGLGVVPSDLAVESWFGMAENGPLATTVADCALVLSVMAGRPELADVAPPRPIRVAVSTKAPLAGLAVHPSWVAATESTAERLQAAGHEVVRADPPYGQAAGLSALARWTAGAEMEARSVADRTALEPRVRRHAAVGRMLLRLGFPRPRGRARWQGIAEEFFARHGVDVLLTPTLAQFPPPAAAWSRRGWAANMLANMRYAPFPAAWNLAGWPAMAVPVAPGVEGLPRSVQLVARPGHESSLLSLAAQLEPRT